MNYFTDLIAKSYLAYISDEEIDIALFYHNEFSKVKPGVKSDKQFSKDHFFKKLQTNLGLLIDDCYTRYSEPVFDPSKMDYETYEYQLNKRREIIEEEAQNDFYNKEINYLNPIPINWEVCDDSVKLKYALKYKGISLKDPINIIKANDETQIILRKSKLEFLKLEVERANNFKDDYLEDAELNLINNSTSDGVNYDSLQNLNEKFDEFSELVKSLSTISPNKEYLNSQETADFLGKSIHTIRSKAFKDKVPHSKPGGKSLVFFIDDLIKYMSSGKVKSRLEIENEADNFIPRSKRK